MIGWVSRKNIIVFVEKEINEKSVEVVYIPWEQKAKKVKFEHEEIFIDLEDRDDSNNWFYVKNHLLNEQEFNSILKYLRSQMSFMKYLSKFPFVLIFRNPCP